MGHQACSGEGIHNNCALGDKFLTFCMVLSMGSVFSKSIANKIGVNSGDLFYIVRNSPFSSDFWHFMRCTFGLVLYCVISTDF